MRCAGPLPVFLALFLISLSFPYVLYNGALYCNTTCDDCEDALNNDTYNTVYLNSSLSSPGATCINNPSGFGNKAFDCRGNTITGSGSGYGVHAEYRSNVTIQNCSLHGFSQGLRARYVNDSLFFNITSYNSSNDCAFFYYLSNSTFANSTLYNCSHEGMSLDYSTGNLITNSTIRETTQQGIEAQSAINNTISYNTFDDTGYGMDFHWQYGDSTGNVIHSNTFNNTLYGVVIIKAYHNAIYNNTMTDEMARGDSYSNSPIGMLFVPDFFLSITSPGPYCDNLIENNTGNGLPVYYTNETVSWSDLYASQVILCNADDSVLDNITVTTTTSAPTGSFEIYYSDNVIMTNSNSTNNQYGLRMGHLTNVTIANSTLQDNYYADFYIFSSNESECTHNIENVTLTGGNALLYASETVSWSNVDAYQVFLCGAHNSVLEGITVERTTSLPDFHSVLDPIEAFSVKYSDNVSITSSSVSGFTGFYFLSLDNLSFSNNEAHNNRYGIQAEDVNNSLFESNTISGSPMMGIYANSGENDTFTSNTVYGNYYGGISVYYVNNSLFENNTVYENEYGIIALDLENDTFRSNTIYANNYTGFESYGYYYDVTGLILDSNVVYENKREGIELWGYVYNATITGNTVYSNGYGFSDPIGYDVYYAPYYSTFSGIKISASADITIANNTIFGNNYYGISLNETDNVTFSGDHIYNNGLADLSLQTDGTAREVYLTNVLFHSSGYPNVSLSDQLEASTLYRIRQAASPNTNYPDSLTAVQDRMINITNITGSPTIDSLTIAWGAPEENRYNESTFDLWRYVTSWVDLNATVNTTSNTVNYSSIATQGAYGLLGIYTYEEDEDGGNDVECTRDSDCGECEACSGGECELPGGACLSDSDCAGEGETCISCGCIPPECVTGADCPSGYSCDNYECTENPPVAEPPQEPGPPEPEPPSGAPGQTPGTGGNATGPEPETPGETPGPGQSPANQSGEANVLSQGAAGESLQPREGALPLDLGFFLAIILGAIILYLLLTRIFPGLPGGKDA